MSAVGAPRVEIAGGAGGGLTDAELRATPVPTSVTGSVTCAGPLTDAELRATAVPVSGTVNATCSGTVAVSNFPASQAVTGTFWQTTQPVSCASLPLPTGAATETTLGTRLADATFTGRVPTNGQKAMAGSLPVVLPSDQILDKPSINGVTAVGAAGAAVTLTLPAPGAGLFHYITELRIELYNTAARTGGATPVTVTSTNLPGTPAWTFPSAGAVGTIVEQIQQLSGNPLKSSTANTASTIVGPATTSVIWRLLCFYYTAP